VIIEEREISIESGLVFNPGPISLSSLDSAPLQSLCSVYISLAKISARLFFGSCIKASCSKASKKPDEYP
jgi:hypothetical protein